MVPLATSPPNLPMEVIARVLRHFRVIIALPVSWHI